LRFFFGGGELFFGGLENYSYFCTVKNNRIMARDHSIEERETPMASEPAAIYGVAEKRRIFSEDELSRGISVEESRRRLTELIYNHYHQL
jgi:hypothetical protein